MPGRRRRLSSSSFNSMAQQQRHPIFDDIDRGDLAAVQQRVLVAAAVLEERTGSDLGTPLIAAIFSKKPAIALWLIEHRGQHNLDTATQHGNTALHYASQFGPLEVAQARAGGGADPAALSGRGSMPLLRASMRGHTDIVAFLPQLPAVKLRIDAITQGQNTALSLASSSGHQPIVQLLLDAGADPTIPAGQRSPLTRATSRNRRAIAGLLRRAIHEAERASALHKARSLLGAGEAALSCLQGRVEQGKAMPQLGCIRRGRSRNEKLQATAAFAVVSGGEKDTGLCEDLYVELLGYMLPLWADKGPAGE